MFNVLALCNETSFLIKLKKEVKKLEVGFFSTYEPDIAYEIFNFGVIDFVIIEYQFPKTNCIKIIENFYKINKEFKIIIIDNANNEKENIDLTIGRISLFKENIQGILRKPADIVCIVEILKSYYDERSQGF